MSNTKQSLYFFLIFLVASFVVVYLIIQPFLSPLILAAVFAFLFQPIYQRLLYLLRKRKSLAAFATTIIAIILVILPVIVLGTQIFKESSQLYRSLVIEGGNGFVDSIENVVNQTRAILPIPSNFEIDVGEYTRRGLEVLIQNFGIIFSSFAKILLSVFVFLMAFYYLVRDGHRLKDYFVDLSPLPDEDDKLIVSRLKLAVSAAVKGNLAIGLIQGALTALGFAIFWVPNAVLWGSVAAITALIPGIGTTIVITPAVIFLFFTDNLFGSAGLLIWGVGAVGMVDYFLGPRLVGHGMEMHPLAVFLAVLGGLAFFGPLGFLFGPLALSVCLVLIDIYFSLKTRENKDVQTQ